ncbi:MAG: HAD family hydrolase [Myxococcales bacterium]|nr:HAD family hydrolase [Myxococcales bacterium]
MARPTHLFFDFFGTLVRYDPSRTGQGHHGSHRLLAREGYRGSYAAFVESFDAHFEALEAQAAQSYCEYSMDEMVEGYLREQLGNGFDHQLIAGVRDSYLAEWSRGVSAIVGLEAMLAELGVHFDLAVVTNTHHPSLVPSLLAELGLAHHFDFVLTSVEHGRRKPCPSIFERALELAGATPGRSVYIGDSFEPDYLGPRSASIRSYLIDPGKRANVAPEDRLESVLQLREWVGHGRAWG